MTFKGTKKKISEIAKMSMYIMFLKEVSGKQEKICVLLHS